MRLRPHKSVCENLTCGLFARTATRIIIQGRERTPTGKQRAIIVGLFLRTRWHLQIRLWQVPEALSHTPMFLIHTYPVLVHGGSTVLRAQTRPERFTTSPSSFSLHPTVTKAQVALYSLTTVEIPSSLRQAASSSHLMDPIVQIEQGPRWRLESRCKKFEEAVTKTGH